MRSRLIIFSLLLSSFKPTTMQAQVSIAKTTDTLKMQYKVSGSGPVLVLVPGGLTGWVSWEPFVPRFISNKVMQVQLLNVQYGLEDKPLPVDYSVRQKAGRLLRH
jgi:hypothetical protein